jgi:hypothetical protein
VFARLAEREAESQRAVRHQSDDGKDEREEKRAWIDPRVMVAALLARVRERRGSLDDDNERDEPSE